MLVRARFGDQLGPKERGERRGITQRASSLALRKSECRLARTRDRVSGGGGASSDSYRVGADSRMTEATCRNCRANRGCMGS